MASLYEDSSTPTPSKVNASAGIAYSGTFSPPAGSWVYVVVSWQFLNNVSATVTCQDTNSNSYASKVSRQDSTVATVDAVFAFFYSSAPGAIQVKITCSNTGTASALIAPRVLVGAAVSQTGAATATAQATSTNVTGSITTTTAGSVVYLVAGTGGGASHNFAPTSGTSTILLWTNPNVGDTSGVAVSASQTGAPGAVTFGFTTSSAASFGWAAVEVLPAVAGGGGATLTGGTAIPALTPVPAGYIVQASDLNNMAYACTFLMNKPIARVHDVTGGQTIAAAGNTAIIFDTKDFDTDGMWNASTPTQLTIQTPGYYHVRFGVNQAPATATAWVLVTTGANNPQGQGVTNIYYDGYVIAVSNMGACGAAGVLPQYLYVSDIVQIFCRSNVTSTTFGGTTGPYFSLEYVSI
jgi:hypothetical protein